MEKISFYGVKKTSDISVEASGTIDINQSANDSLVNYSANFSGLLDEGNSELVDISLSDIRLDMFNTSENYTVTNGVNKRPSRTNTVKCLDYDEGHSDIDDDSDGDNPYVPNEKMRKTSEISRNHFQSSTPKVKRRAGRPPGAKNKKLSSTRKLGKKKSAKNTDNIVTVDDKENFISKVAIETFKRNDEYVNSATGCTSPVKKNKSEKKSRKVVSNPDKWARNVQKKLRNSGKEYKSYSTTEKKNTTKKPVKIGPDCECKKKVYE